MSGIWRPPAGFSLVPLEYGSHPAEITTDWVLAYLRGSMSCCPLRAISSSSTQIVRPNPLTDDSSPRLRSIRSIERFHTARNQCRTRVRAGSRRDHYELGITSLIATALSAAFADLPRSVIWAPTTDKPAWPRLTQQRLRKASSRWISGTLTTSLPCRSAFGGPPRPGR